MNRLELAENVAPEVYNSLRAANPHLPPPETLAQGFSIAYSHNSVTEVTLVVRVTTPDSWRLA
jgi:hypothetical protein